MYIMVGIYYNKKSNTYVQLRSRFFLQYTTERELK